MFDVSAALLLGMPVVFDCIACLRSMACGFVFIVYLSRKVCLISLFLALVPSHQRRRVIQRLTIATMIEEFLDLFP